jgi:hypothetical protein
LAALDERLTHLRFRRTGGFAGNLPPVEVDSAELPGEEVADLERLLAPVDLGAVGDRARGGPGGADAFRYELEVEAGGRRHRLDLGEREVPADLRPLLSHLTRLARRGGPGGV